MIFTGALAAFLCAVVFAALLGTGAPSAGAVEACPNEAIREAQHATGLADCRAWERVSPAGKGDGDIIAEGEAIVAAKAGSGVTFESRMNFGDSVGSGVVGRTTYLARRVNGGWSVKSITPMPQTSAVQVLFASTKVEVFSEDLSTALVWAYDLPSVGNDTPNRENLYLEDTATGALRPVSVSHFADLVPFDFLNPNIWGVSADAKHLGIVTSTQMLAEAEPGMSNVYKWDGGPSNAPGGELSLAGTLPDGSVPTAGAVSARVDARSTMSADGTRLAFTSTGDGSIPPQLYLQIDGEKTAWVSEPEGTDKSDPAGVAFQGMTPDGKNVFFETESPLLDSDTAPGIDLYRWTYSADPSAPGNLTLITRDGNADAFGLGGSLVGMSDDGTRVYVHEASDALGLWEQGSGGSPDQIRTIDPSVPRSAEGKEHLAVLAAQPGFGRVSPDGKWVAYIYHEQMHLYSLADDETTCVSCPGDASLTPTLTDSGRLDYIGFRPRFLSDDGRVFFTSNGALVPEDTNGVADVYEYDGPTKTLSLLSSGKGKDASNFVDSSASGDDVFFVTRQQLVPSDTDEYVDLYDARAGGGFEEAQSQSSPCLGEACQAVTGGSIPAPAIASAAGGRGNLRHARCAKGKGRAAHHRKRGCVKKKHRSHAERGGLR